MSIDLLLIAIVVTLFLIPILTPKGKWFWISSLAILFPLTYLWAEHFYYTSQSDYDYGNAAGAVLGKYIAITITGSFLLGLVSRFCIWFVKQNIIGKRKPNT
jgi:hypothetical protein